MPGMKVLGFINTITSASAATRPVRAAPAWPVWPNWVATVSAFLTLGFSLREEPTVTNRLTVATRYLIAER